MHSQEEFEVDDSVSTQSGIVKGKHSFAMHCANVQCSKELLYLREGALKLLELESQSDDQIIWQGDSSFAMRSVPSKYFWLCGECAETYIVKRWTTSGIVMVPRSRQTAGSHPRLGAHPVPAGTTLPLLVSMTVPHTAIRSEPL